MPYAHKRPVEALRAFAGGWLDGFVRLGIEIGHAGLVAIDEMRTRIAMPLDFSGGQIAAITQDEIGLP